MQRSVHLGYETLLIHVILCVWTISDFCAPLLSPMGVLCSWTCWLLVFSPKNQHKLPLSTHIHQFGYRFERMRFKLKTQWFFFSFSFENFNVNWCLPKCVCAPRLRPEVRFPPDRNQIEVLSVPGVRCGGTTSDVPASELAARYCVTVTSEALNGTRWWQLQANLQWAANAIF